MQISQHSKKEPTTSSASLLIIAGALAFFLLWLALYPNATNPDEYLAAQDGIAFSLYIKQLMHGVVQNPLTFLHTYQQQTIGLIVNIYPPFISGLYALVFLVSGPSLLAAKLVHVAFMIGFLLLLYALLRKIFTRTEAGIAVSILLTTFAFMKYETILMREVPYAFFILLGVWLLDLYFETENTNWIALFFLTLLLGSMTKDFFNFSLPAYATFFFMRCKWTWKTIWNHIRAMLNWKVLGSAILYVTITAGYYLTKILTSSKETEFLFGSFDPVGGILYYGHVLLREHPVLLIATLVSIPLALRIKERRTWNVFFLVLLITFILVMISVHKRVDRYIFMMYPLGAIFAAQLWTILKKQPWRVYAIALIIVGGLLSTIFQAQALTKEIATLPSDADEQVVYAISGAQGNVLLLADYRFDVSYYLRKHNSDRTLIHAFFEKNSANVLAWSRFRSFYERAPECEGMPDTS